MAIYIVGDIQGCAAPLERLLDAVRFDPGEDELWPVGDLINRGPDNLGVLRTLSKAHALAGARIGVLAAEPALVAALRRCQAPYPVPVPCIKVAMAALTPQALERTAGQVELVRAERERMAVALAALPGVRRVYPSAGNFLLVRFADAARAFAALLAAGIVVRDQRAAPRLGDALRITIGAQDQNDRVLGALAGPQPGARRVPALRGRDFTDAGVGT